MNKIKSLLTIALVFFLIISVLVFVAPQVQATTTIYSAEPCDFDSSLIFNHGGTNYTTDSWFGHSIESGGIDNNYLHIGNNAGDNSSRYIISENLNVFPPNATYTNSGCLGFWFRPQASSRMTWFEVQWIDLYGNFISFNFLYNYPPYTGAWVYIGTWGTTSEEHQFAGGYTGLAVGSWYWFELKFFYSGGWTYSHYRNGTSLGSYAGVPQFFSASSQVRIGMVHTNLNNLSYAFWDIDNIRLANTNEFPPAPTPSLVNVAVSSIPINASVTWEDGLEYDLPHNFTAYEEMNHNITAISNVRFNVSMAYSFQGWSIDGSPTVNTSNPLIFYLADDMTLQAIYSPIPIPDWSRLWTNFGIGLFGLIMMFLSWFVAYFCHKNGDTVKGVFLWLVMFIVGYGFFTVLLGG